MGFQWDKDALAKAQEIIAQDKGLSKSLETIGQTPEKTTGQPAGMAGMENRSLRPAQSPEVYIPPVTNREAVYIPPTQEKTLPGQKAPVMVPMKGNPNIPKDYQDLPTPPPPPDWMPPAKQATNEVMYKVPPETTTEPRHPVQIGMKPQILPKNE